jgi:hypothetical protein
MPFVNGQELTAADVELVVSREFDARRFAALCNAISWSYCNGFTSMPSFTEREKVRDGGIDAEIHLPPNIPDSPFFGPGWNVSQYKQRDITARNRDQIYSSLKSSCRGAVAQLFKRWGHRPQRYLFFVNLDLSHEQKETLRQAALQDYDEPDQVTVVMMGAGELAPIINALPHLRSAYFTDDRFQTWETAWEKHLNEMQAEEAVELVGRDPVLADLRSLLDDDGVRGILLSGPSGIGKTRLALQSTEHLALNTVVAVEASLTVSDLVRFQNPDRTVTILIDDPEPKTAEALLKAVSTEPHLKILITLSTVDNAPLPRFGMDERLRSLPLSPLTDHEASELLKKVDARFDYSVESWVIREAGGMPLALLQAAQNADTLRQSSRSFFLQIAQGMEQKLERRLGEEALAALRTLSLLTRTGLQGGASKELWAICETLGDPTVNSVLTMLPKLERAGVVRMRGSYAEVIPPFLASHLAETCLRGRSQVISHLWAVLDGKSQKRFIGRLAMLRTEEVKHIWSDLFASDGLLGSGASALQHIDLMSQIVGAVPAETARVVREGLNSLSLEERSAIKGDERWRIVHLLDQLLCRKKTSKTALYCFARLAEAETDTHYANNSSGGFCAAFYPMHPQVPLPLQDRLDVLRSISSASNSIPLQILSVKAAVAGLEWRSMNALRESHGPDPLDAQPEMTWGDIFDYTEALLSLLLSQTRSTIPEVSQAACEVLPKALFEGTDQLPPHRMMPFIESVVDDALNGSLPLSLSDLLSRLDLVLNHWTIDLDKGEHDARSLEIYRASVARLLGVISRLREGDFGIRLRCYVADWIYLGDDGEDQHIPALAEEAIRNPSLLDAEHLMWLLSDDARRGFIFFHQLGQHDLEMVFRPILEEVACEAKGADAFASYCHGLTFHFLDFLNGYLDDLSSQPQVSPEAILYATRYDRGNLNSITRVRRLIEQGAISIPTALMVLPMGTLLETLRSDDALPFLQFAWEKDPGSALYMVGFLNFWERRGTTLEGEVSTLAWACLEAGMDLLENSGAYQMHESNFDDLASRLSEREVERGLEFFARFLRSKGRERHLNPIPFRGRSRFWRTLKDRHRSRALRTLLGFLTEKYQGRYYLPFDWDNVIDQVEDQGALIAYALENERQAEIVSQLISTAQTGFWPIAFAIVDAYPTNEEVQTSLTHGIKQQGRMHCGPYSEHLERCLNGIERVLKQQDVPPVVRSWLNEMIESITDEKDYRRKHEADRDDE